MTATSFCAAALLALGAAAAMAGEGDPATTSSEPAETRQFTFSWMFSEDDAMAPRGGTTEGAEVTLDRAPSSAWQALRAAELDRQARDRRAILAMAGPYRASFDFIETVGFSAGYTPPRPYRSWGTEYVYVVADEPDFVSLQHILVMFLDGEDGPQGPIVIKHWRQDWQYEATAYHEFRGDGRWSRTTVPAGQRSGGWSQTVWQVDDSPRYASFGHWRHEAGQSIWEGEPTLRPLPRREFSVRDDYDALRAVNRHIITPTGWVHEEQNEKLVLGDGPGDARVLAREAGLNRYERIVGHDFSAGDAYWARTAPFWAEVRAAWGRLFDRNEALRFDARSDGGMLFSKLFAYADQLSTDDAFSAAEARRFIERTLADHVDTDLSSTLAAADS